MSRAKHLRHPVLLLGLGFGSGLAPKAPGTAGSLAAIPLILWAASAGPWLYLALTLLAVVVGIFICQRSAVLLGVHDDPAIVWDEIAGMMLAFVAVPLSVWTLLVGFLIFRWLDIRKPGPIGWCDRHLHGGLGIMADDVLAGVFTCALLHAGQIVLDTLL